MNIILLGYRACGKTSVGKIIAEQTWRDFHDTDTLVRQRFGGRDIRDIWNNEGEAGFRAAEVAVVEELLAQDELIIALGGGTVMQPAARAVIQCATDARRIYLACSPDVLARRIAGDTASGAQRPDLTPLGGGVEEIQAVLAQRDPLYRAVADVVFDVSHASLLQVVQHLTARHL